MNEEATCKSPMALAEEMALALTNHCVVHGIPLSVHVGEEADEAADKKSNPEECTHEPSWRRANLDQVFALINERICVIAGCEEETMDRRLHALFSELAAMLMLHP